jgi:hypothetical protein
MSTSAALKRCRLLLAVLLLTGCGKEVGRLEFAAEGTKSVTVPLATGDVAFWTDIDLDYEGPTTLSYEVGLEQGGMLVANAVCNPLGQLGIKVGWLEAASGAFRSLKGRGKMSCSAHVNKTGPTTVRAVLRFGTAPASATLRKADLLLKQ